MRRREWVRQMMNGWMVHLKEKKHTLQYILTLSTITWQTHDATQSSFTCKFGAGLVSHCSVLRVWIKYALADFQTLPLHENGGNVVLYGEEEGLGVYIRGV